MDLKNLVSKGLDKLGDAAKDNLTEESIKTVIEKITQKLNINLSDDKVEKIVATVKSKISGEALDKVDDLVETEVKKFIK